jgi:hypothetical protein
VAAQVEKRRMVLMLPDLLLRNYRCRESGIVFTRDLVEWIRSWGGGSLRNSGCRTFPPA